MRRPLVLSVAVAGLLALGGCGEPAVDLTVPARDPGRHVLDEAGILEDTAVAQRLAALADAGLDVVAVTYETPRAGLGESRRAGQLVVEEWGADVALVAVAAPGDFTSTDVEARRRFFGLEPGEAVTLPGSLRERIAEERAPPLAEANDWSEVFTMAIDELERELAP